MKKKNQYSVNVDKEAHRLVKIENAKKELSGEDSSIKKVASEIIKEKLKK